LTTCAKARLTPRLGPLTATSIGVDAPKLMTRFTMSLGSKEKRALGSCSENARLSRSLSASISIGALDLSWTCSTASSGPPFQR